MICFLDRSFCSAPNCQDKCGRKLTPELIERGIKWWGGQDFPVCYGEYCDEKGEPIDGI